MIKKQKFAEQAATMQLITSVNRKHVVMPFLRNAYPFAEPNYLNTGMALIGVLRKDQTLDEFRQEWIELKSTFEERSEKNMGFTKKKK